jgi:hypothetical protein
VKIVVLLIFMENNISNFQFFNSFKNWLKFYTLVY